MPVPVVTKFRTGNQELDRVSDALRALSDWLGITCSIIDGRLIENQALVTGAAGNTILHKLGRSYKGYLIVKKTDYTLTHADQATLVDMSLFLNLRASVACTVSVWVF